MPSVTGTKPTEILSPIRDQLTLRSVYWATAPAAARLALGAGAAAGRLVRLVRIAVEGGDATAELTRRMWWLLVIELAALGAAVATSILVRTAAAAVGVGACPAHRAGMVAGLLALAAAVGWLLRWPPRPWAPSRPGGRHEQG